MQLPDERLSVVQSDIAILHEQLDHVAEQPEPERACQFLRRELLAHQQMYYALLRKRQRQLQTTAVGA